jgi:hypothetical protein
MSNKSFQIPRNGAAGVAFLGVQLADASLLIASVFLGLLLGATVSYMGYVLVPTAGFFLNKAFLEWKNTRLPGYLRNYLFSHGVWGYSDAFDSSKTIFVGDSSVINPGASAFLDAVASQAKKVDHGN